MNMINSDSWCAFAQSSTDMNCYGTMLLDAILQYISFLFVQNIAALVALYSKVNGLMLCRGGAHRHPECGLVGLECKFRRYRHKLPSYLYSVEELPLARDVKKKCNYILLDWFQHYTGGLVEDDWVTIIFEKVQRTALLAPRCFGHQSPLHAADIVLQVKWCVTNYGLSPW